MRSSSRAWALAAVCSMGVWSAGVRAAEPAAAETAAPAVAATDLVLLKGGGMLRGTIAELVPHDRVVIVLVTGQRRVVSMSEVEYAGPAAGAPRATQQPASAQFEPPPEAPPPPNASGGLPQTEGGLGLKGPGSLPTLPNVPESEVTFESAEPGLQVYLQTGTAMATVGNWAPIAINRYSPLCTTPCTAHLEPGFHHFAVASSGGRAVPVDEPVNVAAGDSVKVDYQSYAGMRAIGWVALIAGPIVGSILMATAFTTEPCPPVPPGEISTCIDQPKLKTGQMLAGGAVAAGGAVLGIIFILKKDEASLGRGGGPTALRLNPLLGEMSRPGGIASPGAPGLVLSGNF